MAQAGWGRIVALSSEWGQVGWSRATAYSASKAGVISLTKALARQLGPGGITVNAIAPGAIDTPQLEVDAADLGRSLDETKRLYASATPLGRVGRPEEVAATVVFLASEQAGSLTGQVSRPMEERRCEGLRASPLMPGGGPVKIYYAGDVHGSEKCWRKFLNAAKFYEVDTLVMGGDITGKVMVPIVARGGGRHQARMLGRDETVSDEGLDELEKRIRFNGFYPYRCDREEYQRLESDPAHREADVHAADGGGGASLDPAGRAAARRHPHPVLRDARNDDEFAVDEALESRYVINPDNAVVDLGGVQMLSCSWTNPTPWDSPRELPEDELAARLEGLAAQLDRAPHDLQPALPAREHAADRAPQLTDDLRVVMDGGEPRIVSVGSTAVRELIERYQPVLSLHGHIHESKGIAKIGRTTIVNPGSAYSEGVIDGAVVDLRGDTLKSCQLVTG